jgi:hypothetical protein
VSKSVAVARSIAVKLTLVSLWLTIFIYLTCLVAPATAPAAERAKLRVAFVPDRLGAETTIELGMFLTSTIPGAVPSPITGFAMHIPSELELVGSGLGVAVCHPNVLRTTGLSGCSPNAQLGLGSATVELSVGPEVVVENTKLVALMGPPVKEQTGVLIFAEASTPVSAELVFPGVLYAGPAIFGGIGETLATVIPEKEIETWPEGPDASVTYFQLNIGPDHLAYHRRIHGRSVTYRPKGIALPPICPHHGFPFVVDLTFKDGTGLAAQADVPCPAPARRTHRRTA